MLKIDEIIEKWPSAVVARTEFSRFSGGLYTERYLANLDCKGKGPKDRLIVGRKVVYPVRSAAEWLLSRAVAPKKKENE